MGSEFDPTRLLNIPAISQAFHTVRFYFTLISFLPFSILLSYGIIFLSSFYTFMELLLAVMFLLNKIVCHEWTAVELSAHVPPVVAPMPT